MATDLLHLHKLSLYWAGKDMLCPKHQEGWVELLQGNGMLALKNWAPTVLNLTLCPIPTIRSQYYSYEEVGSGTLLGFPSAEYYNGRYREELLEGRET
jgi:hypothetical protein